jgi:isopenicillin N synthase-like dioxygenase
MALSLPILDLSLLDAGPAEAERFRAELLTATHEVGFFYLVGHGVDQHLINELLSVSRRFFELPTESKLKLENIHSPQFRGYTRVGGELTHGDIDWREQIDIGVDRTAVDIRPGTPDYWRLEGPNLWPDDLPELERVAVAWNEQEGQHTAIAMRAHPLLGLRVGLTWVAHDLCERERLGGERVVEAVLRSPERQRPGTQQSQ